jgi:hypothetical protein
MDKAQMLADLLLANAQGLRQDRNEQGVRMNRLALVGALRSGRPIGLEPDGSIATVKMGTFETPEGFMNVPTYWGGDLPEERAIDIARRNKYPMPTYRTEEAAVRAAERNSRRAGREAQFPGYGLRMFINPTNRE